MSETVRELKVGDVVKVYGDTTKEENLWGMAELLFESELGHFVDRPDIESWHVKIVAISPEYANPHDLCVGDRELVWICHAHFVSSGSEEEE